MARIVKPRKYSKRPKRVYARKPRKVMSNAQITNALRRLPPPEVKTQRVIYDNTGAFGIPAFNGLAWGLNNGLYTLHPTQNRIQISQGTGQGQRIGNQIRTKSSYIKGILYANQRDVTYNPTPKPAEVMIYIYRIIGQGASVPTGTNAMTNFYQNGSSSSSPTGLLEDLTTPINRDQYRVVYQRKFKIGSAENTGVGSSTGNQFFANNDYKRNATFYIPLTKFMDKRIKYSDASLTCNNDALLMAIIPLPCDNVPWGAAANLVTPIGCIMTQVYNYTDV